MLKANTNLFTWSAEEMHRIESEMLVFQSLYEGVSLTWHKIIENHP